jgi:hypothetical protein
MSGSAWVGVDPSQESGLCRLSEETRKSDFGAVKTVVDPLRIWTSGGDERRVPAGSFVLFEDVDGKGHKSLHSPEEQTVLWISLPQGLENP